MQWVVQRDGVEAGAEDTPCPTRRGILTGMAMLAAAAGMARHPPRFDETLFYLHGEFQSAASGMIRAEGQRQIGLFHGMTEIATALSVIPSGSPRASAMKRQVADWSFQEGQATLRLPADLVASLYA